MKPKYCVAVADARRARIFELWRPEIDELGESLKLVEIADLVHPERRLRNSEALTDTRPGLRRGSGGAAPAHAVDDRRDAHRDEEDRRFAGEIAIEIANRAREVHASRIVLAASHHMLGLMRASSVALASEGVEVVEIPQDLTKLTAAQLYRHLADASFLP